MAESASCGVDTSARSRDTWAQAHTLATVLASREVQAGDVFFLPPGRIHSIGAGVLLAEVQQASDITYRVYDYDRVDSNGRLRELHTELAVQMFFYPVFLPVSQK